MKYPLTGQQITKRKKGIKDTIDVMWDGRGFRVCGGDFVELGKNKRRNERYDRGSQPGSWLHRL